MKNDDKNDMYKYFPPYPIVRDGQKIIVPMVYDFLRGNSGNYDGLILSAAPGIGKEPCMTSQAILALEQGLFDKVIFIIPTDAGKDNILKELGAVGHGRKVVKLFSKEILCNWMKETTDERIKALESEECAYYLCRSQSHKCAYKDNGCAYDVQKKEFKEADILICDYNYIISPFIRKLSGFDEILEGRVLLLINECHMLKNRAEMILASSISSNTLIRAVAELDTYGYKEEKVILQNILESIGKEVSLNHNKLVADMDNNYEGFGEMILQLPIMQKLFDSESLGERLISIGENISGLKFEQKAGILSYADMVGNFIVRFYKRVPYKDSIIFFLKLKNDMTTVHIGWTPLDVRGFLRSAIKMSSKYVLYSGTIKPTRLKNDVGLGFEKVLTPEPIESPFLMNRKDIILTKERFCHENLRDKAFLGRVAGDLEKLFSHMQKPIGIVCTNQWYENLKMLKVYNILNQPETQEEVGSWLKDLVPKADFIRFSPYGRVAQSVDISCLKSIIFLGFPYPKYGSITQEKIKKLSKKFKGKSGNRKAKATYIQMIEPAYEKIVQSAMRGLRNENDRLHVIYYDVNYKLNKPALGSKNLVVCGTVEEVILHLSVVKHDNTGKSEEKSKGESDEKSKGESDEKSKGESDAQSEDGDMEF
jgi:hypothetical protein